MLATRSAPPEERPPDQEAEPGSRIGDENENWLEVFDAYGVQFLILDPDGDGELLELVRSRPEWQVDFEDKEAVIFARAEVDRLA